MLRLSHQHGVNPSLGLCFFCQKPKEVVLFGKLPDDAEAPREVTLDTEPCDECIGLMKQGIILISMNPALSEENNPYRTGGWCVVRQEAVERWRDILSGDALNQVLEARFGFVDDVVWDLIGLPRKPIEEATG